MAKRFIKLYEQITKWEWYHQPGTLCLFIHLLLAANYKDLKFEGRKIRRGQLVTSIQKLATSTGLSVQQTRTALDHLLSTGEITNESTPKYRIITVVKYDDYQSSTELITNEQQTINKQITSKQQTGNKQITTSIEQIDNIEQVDNIEPTNVGRTASRFTPPTAEEVFDYCLEKGYGIDVDSFMNHYTSNGWRVGKNKMVDWRAAVRTWVQRDKKGGFSSDRPEKRLPAQEYHQRDYSDAQEAAFERMMAMGGEDV